MVLSIGGAILATSRRILSNTSKMPSQDKIFLQKMYEISVNPTNLEYLSLIKVKEDVVREVVILETLYDDIQIWSSWLNEFFIEQTLRIISTTCRIKEVSNFNKMDILASYIASKLTHIEAIGTDSFVLLDVIRSAIKDGVTVLSREIIEDNKVLTEYEQQLRSGTINSSYMYSDNEDYINEKPLEQRIQDTDGDLSSEQVRRLIYNLSNVNDLTSKASLEIRDFNLFEAVYKEYIKEFELPKIAQILGPDIDLSLVIHSSDNPDIRKYINFIKTTVIAKINIGYSEGFYASLVNDILRFYSTGNTKVRFPVKVNNIEGKLYLAADSDSVKYFEKFFYALESVITLLSIMKLHKIPFYAVNYKIFEDIDLCNRFSTLSSFILNNRMIVNLRKKHNLKGNIRSLVYTDNLPHLGLYNSTTKNNKNLDLHLKNAYDKLKIVTTDDFESIVDLHEVLGAVASGINPILLVIKVSDNCGDSIAMNKNTYEISLNCDLTNIAREFDNITNPYAEFDEEEFEYLFMGAEDDFDSGIYIENYISRGEENFIDSQIFYTTPVPEGVDVHPLEYHLTYKKENEYTYLLRDLIDNSMDNMMSNAFTLVSFIKAYKSVVKSLRSNSNMSNVSDIEYYSIIKSSKFGLLLKSAKDYVYFTDREKIEFFIDTYNKSLENSRGYIKNKETILSYIFDKELSSEMLSSLLITLSNNIRKLLDIIYEVDSTVSNFINTNLEPIITQKIINQIRANMSNVNKSVTEFIETNKNLGNFIVNEAGFVKYKLQGTYITRHQNGSIYFLHTSGYGISDNGVIVWKK